MSGEEKRAAKPVTCPACGLSFRGISAHRIVLWLIAITVASFIIGFGILAISGVSSPVPGTTLSPFRHAVLLSPNTTTIPLGGATAADVRLTLGAGELAVTGEAPEGALLQATVFSREAVWQPEIVQGMANGTKTIALTDKGHKGKEWFAVDSPNTWTISLQDQVPTRLDVSVGGGNNRLYLGTLNLETLTVHTGAGDTEIDLAGYHGGRFDATVKNGVGDLTLRVPKESNTRVRVHSGIGDVSPQGFVVEDGTYVTAGFDRSRAVNEIALDQGVGSITLETI